MAQSENRRRSKVVNWRFQFGLAARLLLVLTALFAAGLVVAFAPSLYVVATTNDMKALEPAASELLALHRRVWPAAILCYGGILLYVIRFSHRIAGPVHRIDAVLRALLEDREPPVTRFREDDFFRPTAELLTELTRKLRTSRGDPPDRRDDANDAASS